MRPCDGCDGHECGPDCQYPGAAPIKLACQGCGKSMDYARDIDPTIPLGVVRIEQPSCDECWDGDRETEIWLDAQGREVTQDT